MLNNTNTETYKQTHRWRHNTHKNKHHFYDNKRSNLQTSNAQQRIQYTQKQTSLLRQQTQNLQTSKHTAEDTIRNNKHHTFTTTNTELTRYRS